MNPIAPWVPHLALLGVGVLAVVVLFGTVLWLLLRNPGPASSPSDDEPRAPAPAVPPRPASPAPADASSGADPLLAAIHEGRKIEAIKIYRERTGLGLKESKDAVEALARGQPVPVPPPLPGPIASPVPAPVVPPGGSLDAVHAALRSGNKILAIKHYREATGVGLKEAKDAVEALERRA